MENVAIFIDGSWLYQVSKHLKNSHNLKLLYQRIPSSICQHLRANSGQSFSSEVHFYGSLPENTPSYDNSKQRHFYKFLEEKFGFKTHIFQLCRCRDTGKYREKQVDVAIATDMLDFALGRQSHNVIAFVGGDQDYIPVLTRMNAKGKKLLLVGYNDREQRYNPTSSRLRNAKYLHFPTLFINEHTDIFCKSILPLTTNNLVA